MGWYVHVHVCFNCSRNEGVAKIAGKHLKYYSEETPIRRFLKELSERTGVNLGSKGGLLLWGGVYNYLEVSAFCEALKPFWQEILTATKSDPDFQGPGQDDHILVFEEQEQSRNATAYEIFLMEDNHELVEILTHDELPFKWNQR